MEIVEAKLSDVAYQIRPADLLLFRGHGLVSKLIKWAGRTEHSHAAKVDRFDSQLFVAEVREFIGGRLVTLASQVEKHPGCIDVFQANCANLTSFEREESARYMRQYAGCDYGYLSVLKASLLHLPLIRCLVTPDTNDAAASTYPPFCSEACSRADRAGGGYDPVHNLADHITEPGDLARSPFYQYMFTLAGV